MRFTDLRPRVGRPGFCKIREGGSLARKRTRRRAGAFSIIEVMTATTILLVGFVGLIRALTIGSAALDTARKQQAAQQIITAEIEKLRGGAWSRIANLPATGSVSIATSGALSGDLTSFAISNYSVATTDDNTTLAGVGRGFTCSFERTWLRPGGATAANVTYVKIVYTVSWASNTGKTHKHTVETFVGRNGLHLSYQQT